jgi:hypothetical protein
MAERKLTDLELERHLAGDLPDARLAEATDADRTRLAELRADAEAFMRSVDVDLEVKRIHQRVERMTPAKRSWLRWFMPIGALAAAAAVVLVVIRRGSDDPAHRDDDDLQVKGDAVSLVIHRATGNSSQPLSSGDTVVPGDRIRFEVGVLKAGQLALIGIDGSGSATLYWPENAAGSTTFDPKDRLLPLAIQLDATPGDEHFYALYSAKQFALADVMPALVGRAELPAGISMAEVVLRK